jgi:hypothetical protein
VTEFPLFEYHPESDRFDAMHNIVTSPKETDLELMEAGFTSKLANSDPRIPGRRYAPISTILSATDSSWHQVEFAITVPICRRKSSTFWVWTMLVPSECSAFC